MTKFLEVFLNRRMFLMLLMGFSSGLPLGLTGGTLQAWMSESGVDLKVIGIFSLVGLPYTLKFVWAPLMDRYVPRFLGRRRGWMLISQLALALCIFGIGLTNPAQHPFIVALSAVLIAFFSASQDIVIDAYRADILPGEERGAGAAVSNMGYRLAMLTSGALALIIADHLPWAQVYWVMAACLGLGVFATLICDEPVVETLPPRTLKEAVIEPFLDYFNRRGAAEMLVFIVLYKIDIVMATALTTPFMLQLGFSKTEIGAVTKAVGIAASIFGSLAGGALFAKLGMRRSLWYFGIIQGLSTLSFALLAQVGNNLIVMGAVIGFENFCAGLATAPFIAFLITLCNKRFTATQFALLTSLAAVSRVFAGAPTGFLVAGLGWEKFFIVCALSAIPALALMYFRYDRWATETVVG